MSIVVGPGASLLASSTTSAKLPSYDFIRYLLSPERWGKLTSPAHSVLNSSLAAFTAPYTGGVTQILKAIRPEIYNTTAGRHSSYPDDGLCHVDYVEDVCGKFIFQLVCIDFWVGRCFVVD